MRDLFYHTKPSHANTYDGSNDEERKVLRIMDMSRGRVNIHSIGRKRVEFGKDKLSVRDGRREALMILFISGSNRSIVALGRVTSRTLKLLRLLGFGCPLGYLSLTNKTDVYQGKSHKIPFLFHFLNLN